MIDPLTIVMSTPIVIDNRYWRSRFENVAKDVNRHDLASCVTCEQAETSLCLKLAFN